MKFLSSFIRTFGVLFFIGFTVGCIFIGRMIKDMSPGDPYYKAASFISSFENKFYDYRSKEYLDLAPRCDIKSLERMMINKKVTSYTAFEKFFPENKFVTYSKDCNDFQREEILRLSYFNTDETSELKSKIQKHFSQNKAEVKRVSNLKETRKSSQNKYVSKDIILIKVDDETLAKLNSWPIPRDNWTKLLDNLAMFNTKVVAFDVLFPEEVKTCNNISPDDEFSNAVGRFQENSDRKVIFAYTVQDAYKGDSEFLDEVPGELFTSMVDSRIESDDYSLMPSKIEKHTWPISKLLVNEPDLGYLNMHEDSDGVFRHYQMATNIDDIIFPSLALRSYISFTGQSPTITVKATGNSFIEIGENKLTLNTNGETKIKWTGEHNSFRTISLWEVLEADPNDEYLKELLTNKIAFIGSTAVGAHDLRNSPINSKLPGVYAHMNFVDMLLQQNFYGSIENSIKYSFYFLAASMFTLIVIMFFGNAILDLFTMVTIIATSYYIDYAYFMEDGYQLNLFFIFFCVVSTYSYVTFLNFYQASSEKKQIKGAFSRYVAPSIVDDMLENPDKLKIGGEKKNITCMFSDVRDFTSISEILSPTDLALALNKYMGKMTDIVFETNGTLDKYIGDAIVAFWGAPLDIGDHVDQAVNAAVLQLEALPAINKEFKEKGYPEFKIGLGLNSGDCSVGNMGSDQIFAYTALGDTMNLGARLESLCKYYGAQILVSEYTFARMDQEKYTTRLIDSVIVKGKTEPVGVYEVLYSYHAFMIDKVALKQFKNAYQLFTDGEFVKAKGIFQQILETHSHDKASLRMNETCQKWIDSPPKEGEDWRTTTMTTKG